MAKVDRTDPGWVATLQGVMANPELTGGRSPEVVAREATTIADAVYLEVTSREKKDTAVVIPRSQRAFQTPVRLRWLLWSFNPEVDAIIHLLLTDPDGWHCRYSNSYIDHAASDTSIYSSVIVGIRIERPIEIRLGWWASRRLKKAIKAWVAIRIMRAGEK